MIGYTMVGTRDLKRAISFYDPLFEEIGVKKALRDEQVASWGDEADDSVPKFSTGYPFKEEPATVGNGVMTAFLINSTSRIDRFYEIAMDKSGSDEGAPGFRPRYYESFYSAYVRDPDGTSSHSYAITASRTPDFVNLKSRLSCEVGFVRPADLSARCSERQNRAHSDQCCISSHGRLA